MASGGTASAWRLDERFNRYYRTLTDEWGNQRTQWAQSQSQSQAPYQTQTQTGEASTTPRTNLNSYPVDTRLTTEPTQQPEQFDGSYIYSRQNVAAFSRDGGGTNLPVTPAAGGTRSTPITWQASPDPVDLSNSLGQMSLNESNGRQEGSAIADDQGYGTARQVPRPYNPNESNRRQEGSAVADDQGYGTARQVPRPYNPNESNRRQEGSAVADDQGYGTARQVPRPYNPNESNRRQEGSAVADDQGYGTARQVPRPYNPNESNRRQEGSAVADDQGYGTARQVPRPYNPNESNRRQEGSAVADDQGYGTARQVPRPYNPNESNRRQEGSAVADDQGYETARQVERPEKKKRSKKRSKHSRASTMDQSSIAPNAVPIRASEGGKAKLNASYQEQDKPKKFFKVGVVFACLWSEPAGNNGTELDETAWIGQYGERVYSSIRRFIVVKERRGWAYCLPISTYGGRACAKPNVGAEDHAAVFTHEWKPTAGEPYMGRNPIKVEPNTPNDFLEPESRVNFCKLYSVEHYNKVKKIGQVSERSMPYLVRYYEEAC